MYQKEWSQTTYGWTQRRWNKRETQWPCYGGCLFLYEQSRIARSQYCSTQAPNTRDLGKSYSTLLCLTLYEIYEIMKAELKVCAMLWYPRPRNLSNTVISSAQLLQRRKGFKCLNCVFKNALFPSSDHCWRVIKDLLWLTGEWKVLTTPLLTYQRNVTTNKNTYHFITAEVIQIS